jgi:peptidoglycan/LPS O-acetylase OafA/YrhL
MKITFIGIALVSFLLGAITLYAYYNRNRYSDLVLAAGAAFLFGISMLLTAFSVARQVSSLFKVLSEFLIIITVCLLILRLGENLVKKLANFLPRKNHNDEEDENER